MLRGDNVELVGEKGTKVPNTTVKEITLEVECSLCISLEFSRLKGWQAAKAVEFEVLSLHSKVKGNSMPLPKTLIKTMLNLVLPKVVRRSILPAMPKELGEYLLESGGGLGVAGEIVIQGPPLEALTADLCPARQPERPPGSFSLHTRRRSLSPHLSQALALLRLDEEQAAVLGELLSEKMPPGVLPGGSGGGLTLLDLCRVYSAYRCYPRLWEQLAANWGRALAMLLRAREAAPLPGGASFGEWMDGVMSPLVKKQVSVQFALRKLDININCDMALGQVAEYFRRTVREVHAKGGSSQSGPPVPLHEALANLDTWEHSMAEQLKRFKARFQEMAGSVVASADSSMFAIGLDKLRYVGPLTMKMPMQVDIDEDGAMNWDLKVPKWSFRFPFAAHPAEEGARAAAGEEDGVRTPGGSPAAPHTGGAEAQAATEEWENSPRTLRSVLTADSRGGVGLRPVSSAAVLAELAPEYLVRLVVNRLACRVEPNEAALADLFISRDAALAANTVAAMMRDLLRLEFKPAVDSATGEERYLLQIKTGRMTRTVVEVDSLGLQSPLGPADALRLAHSIMREVMLAWSPGNPTVTQLLDERLQAIHYAIARELLAVCCCIEAGACVSSSAIKPPPRAGDAPAAPLQQAKHLLITLSGATTDSSMPLYLTNEVDLVPLMETLFEAPEIGA